MDLYRRLARLRKVGACRRIAEEFKDRYGPMPPAVENLVSIQELKIAAGAVGIEEIKGGRHGLDFFFAGGQEPDPAIIQGLMGTSVPVRTAGSDGSGGTSQGSGTTQKSFQKGLKFRAVDQFIMSVPAAREDFLSVSAAMLRRVSELKKARAAAATTAEGPPKITHTKETKE
jgi:hypothetical protein